MQARIKWVEERTFLGQSVGGHALVPDAAVENGGRDLGPSPMEPVLIGTGGCSAFDVVEILRKGRHTVTGCQVELEAERAAGPPRVAVERAVQLSAEKYCSASIMPGKSARIAHEITVREAAAA